MSHEYLGQLSAMLKSATSGRFKDVKLECKHFFSGAAIYANGRICMSLTTVGFALKLPEESRNALMKERGAKPLRYFPKAPVKKDYVILPKGDVEGHEDTKTLDDGKRQVRSLASGSR